jgi:methionyl-tRNA formyltransferase
MVGPEVTNNFTAINMHCTALPYGRGGGPIENLILRGHTETIITAHRMVEHLDAGPIYAQSVPVSLAGTKVEILDRFVEPVVDLIRYIVDNEPEPVPQAGEVVTFKRLPKAEMEALWSARS